MPIKRIKLKEKSPEFMAETGKGKTPPPNAHACDMPGCSDIGGFRAPKDRSLSEYYHFCETHISEYNKAWDFFDGMSPIDIEKHIRESMFGDRPTWVYTATPEFEDILRAKASGYRDFDDEQPRTKREPQLPEQTPERDALALMGLEMPTTFAKIRERYRTLMKTYHPDKNPGDKDAEELVKRINMAYTILKAAHEQFAKI